MCLSNELIDTTEREYGISASITSITNGLFDLCSKYVSSFGQILLAVQHGLLHTCLVVASCGSCETEIAIVRNPFPRIALSGIFLRSLELLFVFLIVLSAKRNLSLSFSLPCLNSIETSFLSFITKLLLFKHLFMQ